jgi:hypothetical protein
MSDKNETGQKWTNNSSVFMVRRKDNKCTFVFVMCMHRAVLSKECIKLSIESTN